MNYIYNFYNLFEGKNLNICVSNYKSANYNIWFPGYMQILKNK